MRRSVALVSLGLALLVGTLRAEKTLREFSWSALKSEGLLAGGEILPARAGTPEALRVANAGAARVVPVFTVVRPGITAQRYALRGTVSGEGVEGPAYLEMWNFFPGGGMFFSRTLAEVGPMANLGGTYASRPFLLPFTTDAPGHGPEKLAINIGFPGKGTVTLGPMRLVELDERDDFLGTPGAWLSPSEVGRAGSIVGGVLGTLGALVGILAARRVARPLVMALLYFVLGVGTLSLLGAAAAWWVGQPRDVTYSLALLGVIATGVPGGLLVPIKRQYEEVEFRRMKALDVR